MDNKEDFVLRKFTLEKIRQQALNAGLRPKTAKAQEFYRELIKGLRKKTARNNVTGDATLKKIRTPVPGQLLFYEYKAITYPKQLPFYDQYPLTLITKVASGAELGFDDKYSGMYFYGLNFHYLPIMWRYDLMKKLISNDVTKGARVGLSNRRYDNTTRIVLDEESLKEVPNLQQYFGALKLYRLDMVQSEFTVIPIKYMDIVINLPMAEWVGGVTDSGAWRYASQKAKEKAGATKTYKYGRK